MSERAGVFRKGGLYLGQKFLGFFEKKNLEWVCGKEGDKVVPRYGPVITHGS